MNVSNHALKRFREHHGKSSKEKLLKYLKKSDQIPNGLTQALMGRPKFKGNKEDSYYVSPDYRGIFVVANNNVITYLRFSPKQTEVAKKTLNKRYGNTSKESTFKHALARDYNNLDGFHEKLKFLIGESDKLKSQYSRGFFLNQKEYSDFVVRLKYTKRKLNDLLIKNSRIVSNLRNQHKIWERYNYLVDMKANRKGVMIFRNNLKKIMRGWIS